MYCRPGFVECKTLLSGNSGVGSKIMEKTLGQHQNHPKINLLSSISNPRIIRHKFKDDLKRRSVQTYGKQFQKFISMKSSSQFKTALEEKEEKSAKEQLHQDILNLKSQNKLAAKKLEDMKGSVNSWFKMTTKQLKKALNRQRFAKLHAQKFN